MTLALRSPSQTVLHHIILTSMAVAVALCCVFSFAPRAQAAGLTNDQKSAILNLLAAFGADQTTVTNVGLALNGQAQPGDGSSLSHTTPCSGGVCPGETLTPVQPADSSTLPHSTTCSGGVCPGETLTPAQPTPTPTPTPVSNNSGSSCTIIDCVAGYHASGPACSASQSCIPNSTSNTPPSNSITFSAWPNSGQAPLTVFITITGVSSSAGYSVDFGDGSTGSSWQADTEAANTYFLSHSYTTAGTFTASLRSGCSGVCNTAALKTATITVVGQSNGGNGSALNSDGAQSFDAAGLMAAAVMAPFNILVDSLTELFVAMGVGQ